MWSMENILSHWRYALGGHGGSSATVPTAPPRIQRAAARPWCSCWWRTASRRSKATDGWTSQPLPRSTWAFSMATYGNPPVRSMVVPTDIVEGMPEEREETMRHLKDDSLIVRYDIPIHKFENDRSTASCASLVSKMHERSSKLATCVT